MNKVGWLVLETGMFCLHDGCTKHNIFDSMIYPLLSCVTGELSPTDEHLALEVLKHWDDIPGGYPLVPEHIETRSLHLPEKPGIDQVRIVLCIEWFIMLRDSYKHYTLIIVCMKNVFGETPMVDTREHYI